MLTIFGKGPKIIKYINIQNCHLNKHSDQNISGEIFVNSRYRFNKLFLSFISLHFNTENFL